MDVAWDDLKTILHVAREGTLAGAAARLGVNYTTVARRIARAEARLGETLFERLADGYCPTEAGRLAARFAARMEDEDHALQRALRGRDDRLDGPLTVTAPQLLIQLHLVHVIDAFCTAHPHVSLRVNAANDVLDLTRREADLAVRISNAPGDSLKGRRLVPQQAAGFAAPALARRLAEDPAAPVDWILWSGAPGVPKAALACRPRVRVRARFDDMVAMAGAAQAGLGVVRMPLFVGRGMPGLVEVPAVLPPQPYADIWAVAHADLWSAARVAGFRQALIGYFRRNRAAFIAGDG